MRTVTAMQLRQKLGEILDRASAGERIVIERDHRPLAVLVSYEEGMKLAGTDEERRARGLAALERLDRFRERMAREHPEILEGPSAVEIIRQMRDEAAARHDWLLGPAAGDAPEKP